ncbi:hypothetical protein WJX75_001280 [Coccomyxa subellipsoidea]|uniref:Conserved oligomeric Golgi complex subunit 4 n=1 Tax=Coccomyxa subellipsoidea TaxID=248742 RepID=A0ABR2YKE5_9CHLO
MSVLVPLDFSSVKRLTNLTDINRALHETVARERSIEAELEQLLSKRVEIEKGFVNLHDSASDVLDTLLSDAEQLAASVHSTSELSEGVSFKVRELDTAQSRIDDTLQRISIVVDRSNAVDGIRGALEVGDYETAAEHVSKYLDLERRFGTMTDEVENRQLQDQRRVIEEAKVRLRHEIQSRLDEAKEKGDYKAVLRFTRLFAPLGLQEEGLQAFLSYLRDLISKRAEVDYTSLVEGAEEAETDYVGTLTNLFKDVAVAVDENEQFVAGTFGPEAAVEAILGLQQLCDQHGTKIMQRYIKFRRLQQLMGEIGTLSVAKRTSAPAQASLAVDPRQIEGYLEEMLVLCQRSEEYNQFMLAKLTGAAAGSGSPKADTASLENSFRSGQFNVTVRELIAYYINLEEFYLEENVSKAITIDEWSADALTTSMVDDVFFILQKCGRRALATGNLQCLCAILGQINNLLSNSLRTALELNWKAGAARLAQAVAAATGDNVVAPTGNSAEYAAVFNNADVSATYVGKLREELEESSYHFFASNNERERIKSVLADLSKTSSDFAHITARALEQLSTAIVPRLRPMLDEAGSASYELSEEEYARNEVEDTWVQALLAMLCAILQWLQPFLTPNNYDALVASLLEKVVERVEATLRLKAFNQLGGLQLDRDVRSLVATLSNVTQRTVRDKFAILNQMGTLLSLESVSEVMDYWGHNAGPITWRLTEAQVKEVLGQRTDFEPHEIAALDL